MYRFGTGSVALACAAALVAGCSKSSPPKVAGGTPQQTRLVASFVGNYDAATGKLTITPEPGSPDNPNALSVFIPASDGVADSTPDNTFELRTTATSEVNADGCGPGLNSYNGTIQIYSGFRNQTFSNVWAEITEISNTDNAGCNSADPGSSGLSSTTGGLWSYGTVAYHTAVAREWRFRWNSGQSFGFRGRIVADLGLPTSAAGPKFDWAPTYIASPTRTFKEVPTTMHHLTWTGTTFQDSKSSVTFTVPYGTITSGTSNLTGPASHYADFTQLGYFQEVIPGGQNSVFSDTTSLHSTHGGYFTVCAKFKPGKHPYSETDQSTKNLVTQGLAESDQGGTQGWSLMQMHNAYCFHWRTAVNTAANTMSFLPPGGFDSGGQEVATTPEAWEYDYICGGRTNETVGIQVGLHGVWPGMASYSIGSDSFIDNDAMPLVLGAYADSSGRARDAGLYEVIFDSRPATLAVMNEIVAAAEGRDLPNAAYDASSATTVFDSQRYLQPFTNGVPVLGADQTTAYTLAPFLTKPLPADGTGLLPAQTRVDYTRPFNDNTRTSGYCIGAELKASGAWRDGTGALVYGTILSLPDGFVEIHPTNGFQYQANDVFGWALDSFNASVWTAARFTDGSAHRFTACVDPVGSTNKINLYIDGTLTGSADWHASTTPSSIGYDRGPWGSGLTIQGYWNGLSPFWLTGAQIRRVFACPTNDETQCR